MKKLFSALLMTAALIPAATWADVKSDMANSELSLVTVMQNALASGLTSAQAVAKMIEADSAQTTAIVATAMTLKPEDYAAIIKAAIDSGADADVVVAAALVATGGENSSGIQAAALAAAPSERDAIRNAVSRVSSAKPIDPTVASASGGGAGITAEEVIGIQSSLAQIEADLVAAGFSGVEAADAVSTLTGALAESQATVDFAQDALAGIQADLEATIAAQEALPGLLEEQAAAQAAAADADAAIDAAITAAAEASAAVAQQELAIADAEDTIAAETAAAEALEAQTAALEGATAEEAIAILEAEIAASDAELEAAGYSSDEELDAAIAAETEAINDLIEEQAEVDVEIQQVEALLAELEGQSQATSGQTDLAVTDQTVDSLQALLTSLRTRQEELIEELPRRVNQRRIGRLLRVDRNQTRIQTQAVTGLTEGGAVDNAIDALEAEITRISLATELTQSDLTTLQNNLVNLTNQASDLLDAADQILSDNSDVVATVISINNDVASAEAAGNANAILENITQVNLELASPSS